MDIFQIDRILLNILKENDLECICDLLVTNKYLNQKITKYYKDIVFHNMPLLKPCNNI
jgi:hypothetical protein